MTEVSPVIQSNSSLDGRRILVIEDDFLVAQVLMDLLEEAGAQVLGPIGWIDDALTFIEREHASFDSAVLDVNLHGEKSYPIADALLSHGAKVVFTTGYGAAAVDEHYRGFPRCEKPFNPTTLVRALKLAVAEGPSQ